MYNLKNILDKEPVAIAGALRSLLYIAVLGGLLHMDAGLLAAIALGAEITLGLFVRNASTPNATSEQNVAEAFQAGAEAGSTAKEQDISLEPSPAHVAAEDIPGAPGEG
jgi:hypothetical protein